MSLAASAARQQPYGDFLLAAMAALTICLLIFKCGVVSWTLNYILRQAFPIKNIETGTSVPGCPYRWPNGQGNEAKFIYGKENSTRWRKEFGPLYRIWSGMTPEIVLTKPKHVKDVFRDSDKHSKAMDNNSGYLMNQLLGQCVGLISGRSWKTLRAAVEGPFLQSSSKYQLPMIINRTRGYLDGLATTSNLDQGLLHPVRDLKMLPFWIIADMLYGTLSDQMETELREMAPRREELFKYVIKGGATRFHWTQILPSKANRELKRFNTEWRVFNKKAYERARAEGAKAPIFDMFENVKCGRVSEEQILQTLDEILFANLDVTMGGLSWNLVFLAANSRVQQKLLDEILKGTGPGTGEDPAGTNSYLLSSSTFLSACILESARLRPLAAFSVPQSAPSRRVIEGFDIPSGVNFVVDAYSLNTNVDFWGSDSLVYRPERFIEQKNTDFRYNYWRYGFGPRQCLGKHVADLVIRSLLVLFLPTHKLSLRHDSSDWQRLEEVWINHPDMELECRRRS